MNKHANDKRNRFELYTALSIALVCIVFGALLTANLALLDFKKVHRNVAKQFFNDIDKIEQELANSFNRLNQLNATQCDEGLVLEMRRVLFNAEFVRDFGFLNGRELLCTTGIGILNPSVTTRDYDFVTASGLGLNINQTLQLFESEVSAVILQQDNFNAVFDTKIFGRTLPDYIGSLITYPMEHGEAEVIRINTELAATNSDSKYNFSFSRQLYKECAPQGSFCIYLETDKDVFFEVYRLTFTIIAILLVLFGILVALLTYAGLLKRSSIDSIVKRGLKGDNFHSLYQPIVSLKTGEVIGCEALARYHSKEQKLFPDEFIPAVIRLGATVAFTEKLFYTAFKELNESEIIPEGFRLSFNLFPSDVSSGKIEKMKLQKDRKLKLVFEITEDQKLEGANIKHTIEKLKSCGSDIALDDFGTGYSNLDQIQKLNFDYLKIDRSYVMDMEEGSIKSDFIPYIVKMSTDLNMKIVAEGVENQEQANMLADMGIHYAQGWYFGKPMTLSDLEELIRRPLEG